MKLKLIITSMIIILFSACNGSNKSEASVENFTRVINEHFKQKDFCIKLTDSMIDTFPAELNKGNYALEAYKAYEKMGFLALTPQRVKYRGMPGGGDKDGMTDGYKVTLTEKGKKAYHEDKRSFGSKGFCIGYYQVKEISNYTTPADRIGLTMSKVDYTLTPMNVEDKIIKIVKEEQAKGKFRNVKVDNFKNESQALILTEMKGWVHEKDMR